MQSSTPYPALVFRKRPEDFSPSVEVSGCYIECRGSYLLLKRSLGRPQENTWGVPAGKREQGETPLQCVLREIYEEIGLRLGKDQLTEVGCLYVKYPHIDFVYHMFHYESLCMPELSLSEEHQEFCWVPLTQPCKLPLISGGKEAIEHFKALVKKTRFHRKPFYVIRHGETDGTSDSHIKCMDVDFPLNANGKKQALLKREIVHTLNLQTVCSSPMQRAKETKELLVDGLDLTTFEIDGLGECQAKVWSQMVLLEEGREYQVTEEVERFLARTVLGVNSALEKPSPTLIVAHGGLHWAICYLMGIQDHSWKSGTCELWYFRPKGSEEWVVSSL